MTSRDLLAKPTTAKTASRQNASAAPMAITCSSRWFEVMSPAVKETMAAATASTKAMMARHGRAWSLTLAICRARSSWRFSCRSTGTTLLIAAA